MAWHDLPDELYEGGAAPPEARTALGRRWQRFGWKVLSRVVQDEDYPTDELSPLERKRLRERRDGGAWGWYGLASSDDEVPMPVADAWMEEW